MTLVKCFNCGSEQDFEAAVGYCEQCGRKLPVPHRRGKVSARKQFMADQRQVGLNPANVRFTVILGVVGVLCVLGLVVMLAK